MKKVITLLIIFMAFALVGCATSGVKVVEEAEPVAREVPVKVAEPTVVGSVEKPVCSHTYDGCRPSGQILSIDGDCITLICDECGETITWHGLVKYIQGNCNHTWALNEEKSVPSTYGETGEAVYTCTKCFASSERFLSTEITPKLDVDEVVNAIRVEYPNPKGLEVKIYVNGELCYDMDCNGVPNGGFYWIKDLFPVTICINCFPSFDGSYLVEEQHDDGRCYLLYKKNVNTGEIIYYCKD